MIDLHKVQNYALNPFDLSLNNWYSYMYERDALIWIAFMSIILDEVRLSVNNAYETSNILFIVMNLIVVCFILVNFIPKHNYKE